MKQNKYSNTKQVKKQISQTSKNNNFYLTIYNYIKDNGKLPLLGISKQRLNYYVKTLKRQGYIKKVGYGTWETSKKYRSDIPPPPRKKEVRGHAFIFNLSIPKIYKWNRREEYLFKQNIPQKKLQYGQQIQINNTKVHLFNKSIVVYYNDSYIAQLAKEAKSQALADFLQLINKLERLFNVSFKLNKGYKFKVCREHYSLIKNALARQYDKENKQLYIYNEKGLWFIIDNSFNLHEAETTKLNEAVQDNEGVQEYFNSHKRTNFEVTPEFTLKMINILVKDRQYWAEHQKTHIKYIKKLGEAVEKLTDKVNDLKY